MKASAYMELTPTSFASPSTTTISTTTPAAPTQGEKVKPSAGLMNLAPKPAGPASTQLQSQSQVTTPGTPRAAAAKQQKSISPRTRKSVANGAKRTVKKRRRGNDDDEGIIRAGDSSSDESGFTPTATQTKSGRQVHRPSLYVPPAASSPLTGSRNTTGPTFPATQDSNPATTPAMMARKRKRVVRKGKEVNVNCVHCQRGHSPLSNTIVFCDWCNRAWHQLCHDPPIDEDVIQVKEKEWLCKQCKPVSLSNVQPTVVQSNPYHPQNQITRTPLAVPPLEVGGAGLSDDDRRGYLSSLSHATLVELLVTLSDRNPDVSLFPANLKDLSLSKFPSQSSVLTAVPVSTTPAEGVGGLSSPQNGSALAANGVASKEQDSSTTADALSVAPNLSTNGKKSRHELSGDEESEYEVFEDHRLYPRAGNGFRMSLNPEDLDILREDPACPTFSYSLHGPAKARAEANDAVPVWGSA